MSIPWGRLTYLIGMIIEDLMDTENRGISGICMKIEGKLLQDSPWTVWFRTPKSSRYRPLWWSKVCKMCSKREIYVPMTSDAIQSRNVEGFI
jgi:hypothetical protein